MVGSRPAPDFTFASSPAEIKGCVLAFLEPRDLAAVALLSHDFCRLADCPTLWRGLSRLPHQQWEAWRGAPLSWKLRVRRECRLPSRLRALEADGHIDVTVTPDGHSVRCGPTSGEFNTSTFSDRPISATSSLFPYTFYFEVTVLRVQDGGCVSIGFVSDDYPRYSQVGWRLSSCGFHSDDGKTFFNQARSNKAPLSGPWGPGDVAGCGLSRGQIFFTLNGVLQSTYFPIGGATSTSLPTSFPWQTLYPAVGVDRADLTVNFGEQPFRFRPDAIRAIPELVAPDGNGDTDSTCSEGAHGWFHCGDSDAVFGAHMTDLITQAFHAYGVFYPTDDEDLDDYEFVSSEED